ncbi:hypothetical protein [Brevibacillus brevis]|uniref:hypothetical protein n=1 Tax=Brevibacillus brevis TaxID=1393 RepID=UPI00165D8235|nr:hypothetical protein [Brevibacillus brevis]
MDELINKFGSDEYYMGVAGLCSVVGLALSIYLIILTAQVNKKIDKKLKQYTDIENFNANREKFRTDLETYQLLINKDNILNEEIVYKISNIITEFENHPSLLNVKDKYNIWFLKYYLGKTERVSARKKIAGRLSYFISRFNKKEERF